MSWIELSPPAASLSLRADGIIEWNTAFQVLLGNPEWVRLVWDGTERRLGVYHMARDAGFAVYAEPESGEYRIDSTSALDAAGVSTVGNYSETPAQLWVYDGSYLSHERPSIYYLTLP